VISSSAPHSDMSAERVGQNQALFRDVNERLKDLNKRLERLEPIGSFLCECGDVHCTEQVEMTAAEYAELRDHPLRFAVAPGHVFAEYEGIVFANDRYTVVEKYGAAAEASLEAPFGPPAEG
jgi:hypothetical protein